MTGDESIQYFSEYFKSYAIGIASFLLDYESDEYKFNGKYDEDTGSISFTCSSLDEDFSVTKHFPFFSEVTKYCGEDVVEVAINYLYKKGIETGQCPKEFTRNEFIAVIVCNYATNYANEVRDLNFEK